MLPGKSFPQKFARKLLEKTFPRQDSNRVLASSTRFESRGIIFGSQPKIIPGHWIIARARLERALRYRGRVFIFLGEPPQKNKKLSFKAFLLTAKNLEAITQSEFRLVWRGLDFSARHNLFLMKKMCETEKSRPSLRQSKKQRFYRQILTFSRKTPKYRAKPRNKSAGETPADADEKLAR